MMCFVLVLVLAGSGVAFAQDIYPIEHREWEATGFAGGSFSNKFQLPTPVLGSLQESSRTVGMSYDAGCQVGVRINQNLNDWWAADLEYSFANQFLRFTNLSPSIQSLTLDQYLHNLSYDVSYLPLARTKRARPYVAAGIAAGWFYLPGQVKKDALELGLKLHDSWEFVFNVGGGFKYLFHDQFAVTFDVKDRISRLPPTVCHRRLESSTGSINPASPPTDVCKSCNSIWVSRTNGMNLINER